MSLIPVALRPMPAAKSYEESGRDHGLMAAIGAMPEFVNHPQLMFCSS
jgi:hypothetical protein